MNTRNESNNHEIRLSETKSIANKLRKLTATFGATLAVHMKARKLTSEAMAEALNISP